MSWRSGEPPPICPTHKVPMHVGPHCSPDGPSWTCDQCGAETATWVVRLLAPIFAFAAARRSQGKSP
jgi:hypothetical protein